MKKKYVFIISFITLVAVLGFLYYNMGISNITDNAGIVVAQNNVVNDNLTGKEGTTQITSMPSNGLENNGSETILERNLVIFIDKNGNETKDADESACLQCANEQAIVTKQKTQEETPSLAELQIIGLSPSGTIAESKLTELNTIWGVLESKNILIPISPINLGDGASDALIPAVPFSVKIAGVNSNILVGENIDNETIYSFNKLIPTMQTASGKNSPIYVKFTSTSEPTKYYLNKGTITIDGSTEGKGYLLKIKWGLPTNFNPEVINPINLTFYVI